jgi:hypothetical protein
MKRRLSIFLVLLMIIPSFSAFADMEIAGGDDIEFPSIAHLHFDDLPDETSPELVKPDFGGSASYSCHHCDHCHSLSFFFVSEYKLPSSYFSDRERQPRHHSPVASMIISPDLRPPIF